MTAFVTDWPASTVPPAARRRSTPRSGDRSAQPPATPLRVAGRLPSTPQDRRPGQLVLRVSTTCLRGCGWSETGLTSDPPDGPRPRGWGRRTVPEEWTRWAELEYRRQRHEHPADVVCVPAGGAA